MQMIKYIVIAMTITLPQASLAYVDVLSTDDMLFLAWTADDQSHLFNPGSSSGRTFTSPEITIGAINVNGELFIASALSNYAEGAPDSIYLLDPVDLSTESVCKIDPQDLISGSFLPEDVWMSIRIARHTMSDTPVYITATSRVNIPPDGELSLASARYVPDTLSMELTLAEAHGALLSYYYCGIKSLTSPISCGQSEPMCFWIHYFDWHGVGAQFFSGIHQEEPIDKYLEMDFSTFYHDNCYYFEDMPKLKAAGSCSEEILLLWTSAFDEELFCASFDATGPDTVTTYEFPYAMPPPEAPWAMSCNPDDTGLLLVWYDEGSIISRHYSGDWNPYAHPVQSGLSNIEDGNLAVCSDENGYWVAWLESGRSEPQFVFIPRDSVTSIDETEMTSFGTKAGIYPLLNPTRGPIRLNVEGFEGAFDVFVYNVAGRLELHQNFSNEGNIIFTEELLPGIYTARAVSGMVSSTCRILVLR